MSKFSLDSTSEQGSRKPRRDFNSPAVYGILFGACLLASVLTFPVFGSFTGSGVCVLAALLVGALLGAGLIFWRLQRLDFKTAVFLLFLAGVVLRLGYVLSSSAFLRQHDVFDQDGHFQYIMHLAETWRLPESNNWQYNHPPLHHFLSALWVSFFQGIGVTDQAQLAETLQLLTCFYSCAMLVVIYRILQENFTGRRAVVHAYGLLCLHPTFFLLAGSLNNDCLMVLLFFVSILYTLRWYRDPSLKNSLLLAAAIGCCMMAKVSGAAIAPVTAAVFTAKLIVLGRDKNWKQFWTVAARLAAFGVVCVLLGLWYPVRNLILFQQPLGYVAPIGTDAAIYCGDQPLWSRFVPFAVTDWQNSLYCEPFEDYNIFAYVIKCAVFGETSLKEGSVAAAVLLICSFLLMIGALISMVWILVQRKRQKLFLWVLAGVMAVQIAVFVFSNLQYPYGCTMDFRYLAPTLLPGAVFLGMGAQRLWRSSKRGCQYLGTMIYCVSALFGLSSMLLYLTLPQT